jgi:predicted nucleic acid-binding protein
MDQRGPPVLRLVIDASLILAWSLPDEDHPLARKALRHISIHGAVVPALWLYEVRNGFIVAERRGRLSAQESAGLLADLQELDIALDARPEGRALMAFARAHRLTVYDAAYLELALRLGASLATLDAALCRASTTEGASLFV